MPAVEGQVVPGVRWIRAPNGEIVGYRNPITDADENLPGLRQSLRNVATRCQIPNTRNASNFQTMTRSAHWARDNITSLKLLYGNWAAFYDVGETSYGVNSTFAASIEYPAGVMTQVRFGGGSTATVAALGEVISDFTNVRIPKGAQFWVRTWASCAGGIHYSVANASTAHGEAFEFGATTADKTMSGTLTDTGSGMFVPFAILGMSDVPSLWLAGDSRLRGQGDAFTGSKFNDVGQLARAFGPQLPYINAGIPTEAPHLAAVGSSRRVSLAKRFCTHVISNYGINGVNFYSRTAAQTLTDLQALWALFDPLPVYQCTLPPVSTSTDSWATTVNQTTAASNANRVTLNNSIRQSVGVSGVFELADVVESARDSGLWKAPGYTADGLHETQLAYISYSNSGALRFNALV